MERFKKLLNVYTNKDIQHFLYLLERAEIVGMDIRSTRTATSDFLRVSKMERKRPERVKKDPDKSGRVISLGRSKQPCPQCGKSMLVSLHTDVENNKVPIAKCKACQFSKIVEMPNDG